jgi:Bifunctional DNA primase/polymerase, N-terminal
MTAAGERSPQDAALAYASAGWPVFPVTPGGKTPALPAAHPPGDPAGASCKGECGRDGHGFHDATTDPERIREWWGRDPGRNVGIATGKPGPVVDVDNHGERGTGFAAWNELKRAGLVEGPRALVRTPGGGFHAYFAGTDQASGKIPGRHLDWRARGGYVVAPPSHAGGRPYEVVHHEASDATVDFGAIRGLLDPQPQRAPAREHQAATGSRGTSLDRLADWVAARNEGDRNFPLFYAAKQAALAGQLDGEGVERLVDASLRSGLRGGEREARRTIASGLRAAELEASPRPFGTAARRQLEAG